jgi:hypothetical protein
MGNREEMRQLAGWRAWSLIAGQRRFLAPTQAEPLVKLACCGASLKPGSALQIH